MDTQRTDCYTRATGVAGQKLSSGNLTREQHAVRSSNDRADSCSDSSDNDLVVYTVRAVQSCNHGSVAPTITPSIHNLTPLIVSSF